MPHSSGSNAVGKRPWVIAGLALLAALAFALVLRNPNPVAEFEKIQPGMTYQEVQAVLVQPHVASPLARSFGTPVKDAEAVLKGDPSFEKDEWGRVDNPSQYEPEWARVWKKQNGVALSTAERRMYTVRQWGVANTQSYSFIAIFDAKQRVVCRYWTVPTESAVRGWLRKVFGL
jgi:hypothetical protein